MVVVDEVVGQWLALAGARLVELEVVPGRISPVPAVRHLEAAARPATGSVARRTGHRGRRSDGRGLCRTCLIRGRMVQSLLNMAIRKSRTAGRRSRRSHRWPPSPAANSNQRQRVCQSRTPPRHHRRRGRAGGDRLGFVRDRRRCRKAPRPANWWSRAANNSSEAWTCDIGIPIADSLHPVANPAVDTFGNIYTTFSGSRGQKVPVAVYKIDLNYNMKPFINEMMNATGLAFDRAGHALRLQPLRRQIVYQVTPNGNMSRLRRGHGGGHRAWRSTTRATSTSATAAARFSRSAPTGRSSCSPRWSLRSRLTTWRSARMGICT